MNAPRCSLAPYAFLAPFFALFAGFVLLPLASTAGLSLFRWNPTEGWQALTFVGFENYAFVLDDPWFWHTLRTSAWLTLVGGLPQHLLALPLAWLVWRHAGRGQALVSGIYFLPFVTSSVAVALAFSTLFASDTGLANQLLATLRGWPGLSLLLPAEAVHWLSEPDAARWVVAMLMFWRYLGWNLVLYLAALQVLPEDGFEAATLDGASGWQQFRHIALPQLRPTIAFAVTLTWIGGLQLFDEPLILAQDGRAGAAQTTAIYVYRNAFEYGDFGAAAAMAWLLLALIAVGAALLLWLLRTREPA
ncbi:carbohydrate ABC transporter permease [Chitinolyticbacter meiyuanensis]|uniref:carbohydrate ABC transporter permease n=1 Tax=Chitinolyticbacter meiyuanensis TaxID=682798 RepID=UPI0011E5DF42|nr:sugar ABC transporter permease [Chitinolyticbacter meiyuanensis]